MKKNYYLPRGLRSELRKIWGIPIFGRKEKVLKKFQKLVREEVPKKIITIGDYCSLNLPSHIKIFDGKVKRRKIKKVLDFSLMCQNPPGTIQGKVWPIIKMAIEKRENVFAKGEEDLLVIPAVLLAEKNSLVVYGFSGKGICLIKVTPEVKKIFKELLKKFKTN